MEDQRQQQISAQTLVGVMNGDNEEFQFPPGYRFQPTDSEIIEYYLKPKLSKNYYPRGIIYEVDFYKSNPDFLAG